MDGVRAWLQDPDNQGLPEYDPSRTSPAAEKDFLWALLSEAEELVVGSAAFGREQRLDALSRECMRQQQTHVHSGSEETRTLSQEGGHVLCSPLCRS